MRRRHSRYSTGDVFDGVFENDLRHGLGDMVFAKARDVFAASARAEHDVIAARITDEKCDASAMQN